MEINTARCFYRGARSCTEFSYVWFWRPCSSISHGFTSFWPFNSVRRQSHRQKDILLAKFRKTPLFTQGKNSRGQVNVRTRCSLHIPGRKSCLSLGEFTFHRCPASRKIPLEQVYPRFHDIKVFFALWKAWLESFCQLSRGWIITCERSGWTKERSQKGDYRRKMARTYK